jgi:hypothetical protein
MCVCVCVCVVVIDREFHFSNRNMKPLSRCILVFRQISNINPTPINFWVKILYSLRVLKEKTHRRWARCYAADEGHLRDLRFSQRYGWSSLRSYALSVGKEYPTFKNIAVPLKSTHYNSIAWFWRRRNYDLSKRRELYPVTQPNTSKYSSFRNFCRFTKSPHLQHNDFP